MKAMGKTARRCRLRRRRKAKQHPAILPWLSSLPLNRPAILRPVLLNRQRPRCRIYSGLSGLRFETREHAAHEISATNTQPLDQRLVTRCIDSSEVVEKLAPLRHELEQSPPGVIVLDVGLEVLGETVDALRKDRHLHFRRTGVAGLGRIALDHFGLAAGCNRHRVVLFLSGFTSAAAGPGCRPARSPPNRGKRVNSNKLERIPVHATGTPLCHRGNIAKPRGTPAEIARLQTAAEVAGA